MNATAGMPGAQLSLLRSGLRGTETAPCGDSIAGHFSKSVRSGAPGCPKSNGDTLFLKLIQEEVIFI